MPCISMNKQYKTVSGLPVRILCINIKNKNFPIAAAILNPTGQESILSYTKEGFYLESGEADRRDLIEVKPWDSLKNGDKCLVRNDECEAWRPRIFKEINNSNMPVTYDTTNMFTAWNQCMPFDPCALQN